MVEKRKHVRTGKPKGRPSKGRRICKVYLDADVDAGIRVALPLAGSFSDALNEIARAGLQARFPAAISA